nr:tRNA dihydrouridine synthase DusB [Faunimonas pinastri]
MNSSDHQSDVLAIGGVKLPNRAFLAPMSGVSDLPFRRMAARYGAGVVVSEMVACEAAAIGSEEARLRSEGEGLDLHVVQLSGRDPEAMRVGVKVAEHVGAAIIDINMGCPARKVTSGYAGSHLMRDVKLACDIIDATVQSASVPVTVKMRLGWDETSLNAPELARRAEDLGAQMITVHGRTRCQFYNGRADWEAIRRVKDAVSIPVVANGDLTDPSAAPAMLERSGADGVMIGRGSYGQPWIVGQTAAVLAGRAVPEAPRGEALLEHMLEHYEMILACYGRFAGTRIARKHLGWYLDRAEVALSGALKTMILTSSDAEAVQRALREVFSAAPESAAA